MDSNVQDQIVFKQPKTFAERQTAAALLERVKSMLAAVDAGQLPDDYLPESHWGHRYCPYLEVCEPGQKAMDWQKKQPKSLPDEVVANMIAKRIVAKKGAEKLDGKKKKGQRSLSELAEELDWE